MRAALLLAGFAVAFVPDAARGQRRPVERRDAVPLLTIGEPGASGRAGASFITISDVKITPSGHFVVLDSVGRRVHVLAPDGTRLVEFGKWGRGPGEFLAPTGLAVTDSSIVIRDGDTGTVHTFTLQGRPLRSAVERRGLQGIQQRARMRGGATLVVRTPAIPPTRRDEPAPGSLDVHVGVQGAGRGVVEWLFRVRSPAVYLRRASDTAPAAPVPSATSVPRLNVFRPAVASTSRFGAGGAWAVSGDSLLAHADGYSGDVTWYAFGARGASVVERGALGRTGREVSPDEVAEETERLNSIATVARGGDPLAAPGRRFPAELLGAASRWSVATTAFFDDGTLWVGINRIYHVAVDAGTAVRVGVDNTWAVFPPVGNAFTVTLRPLFRVTQVRGGRIHGYVDDGAGAPFVAVYVLR